MGWYCLAYSPTGFLLVARLDHTTRSRNIKPEVILKRRKWLDVSFCLIMGSFKGELPAFARLSPVLSLWSAPRCHLTLAVRQYYGFTTGAVRSAILATAGLLVEISNLLVMRILRYTAHVHDNGRTCY